MKKNLPMLLAAIMLLFPACGQDSSTDNPSSAPSEQVNAPIQTGDDNTGPAEIFDPSATIEETVLVDESDVKITVTGIKYTAYSVKLDLTIENNSSQNLSFHAGTLGYSCNSVNGYMVDNGYLYADVGPGKKSNESVSFSVDELTLLGIADIADIELGFSITTDDYDDYLITGPRQVRTSLADSYDYAADTYRRAITDNGLARQLGFTVVHDSGDTPFAQKGVRVLSQTLITNSSGEPSLLVEVENNSGDMVYVSVGDTVLNGLGVQSGTWSTDQINSGKRRVIAMNLSSMLSYPEPFGLSEIGSVAYSFKIMDLDRDVLVVPPTLTFSVPGSVATYDTSGTELYQENGIRVVAKGLAEDTFELSDDLHLLLLIENNSSEQLQFDADYNSVSVNGYMTNFICYSKMAAPGGATVLDIELMGSSLEKNDITSLGDVTEVELTIKIKNDSYKTIAEPVVTFTVG